MERELANLQKDASMAEANEVLFEEILQEESSKRKKEAKEDKKEKEEIRKKRYVTVYDKFPLIFYRRELLLSRLSAEYKLIREIQPKPVQITTEGGPNPAVFKEAYRYHPMKVFPALLTHNT